MANPWISLLNSRKFWVMLLDLGVSVSTYFVTKYAGAAAQDTLFLIGALQPVFLTLILAITAEDRAAMAAGYRPWERLDNDGE